MPEARGLNHAVPSASLADILERVLDKGVVISGDIRVKLVDVELLTIQIRLVICSVDRAREMGMDWWRNSHYFQPDRQVEEPAALRALGNRLEAIESSLARLGAAAAVATVPAEGE